jgi:hypothetical protein
LVAAKSLHWEFIDEAMCVEDGPFLERGDDRRPCRSRAGALSGLGFY